MSSNGIPGVDYLPPLPPISPSGDMAKLKQELAAKQAEIEKLQSDLRIAKFSIQQMEEENNSLIHRLSASNTKTVRKAKKKKAKGGKQGRQQKKKGSKESLRSSPEKDGRTSKESGGGEKGEDEEGEGEEISMEMIAERLPDVKLSLVITAEKQFAEADRDDSGFLDAKELDMFLTKNNQIFSEQQIHSILKSIDADGDEQIDFLEYVTILYLLQSPKAMTEKKQSMDAKTAAVFGSLQSAVSSSKTCVLQ